MWGESIRLISLRPTSVLSLLNPPEMGGTGRKRRGGKDCAKRKNFGREEKEKEKRKERRCMLKCSVVARAPTCLPRFFSSRLYPPRLYTKGGGKGVTYSPVLCPPERTSEASERGSKKKTT